MDRPEKGAVPRIRFCRYRGSDQSVPGTEIRERPDQNDRNRTGDRSADGGRNRIPSGNGRRKAVRREVHGCDRKLQNSRADGTAEGKRRLYQEDRQA